MICQLAICDDRRPLIGVGLPPYAIITHSVKRSNRKSVEQNMFHMTTTTGEKTCQTSDKPSNGRVQHVRMYGGYFSVDRIFQFRQT
ncbi:hypothetical protein TNCV_1474611 [Trichonephila clavipes]|nr:hypothetical protein TNCV_1474611 [Trichonephila clavipes]